MTFKHEKHIIKNEDEDGSAYFSTLNYTLFFKDNKLDEVYNRVNFGTAREYPYAIDKKSEVFEMFEKKHLQESRVLA